MDVGGQDVNTKSVHIMIDCMCAVFVTSVVIAILRFLWNY